MAGRRLARPPPFVFRAKDGKQWLIDPKNLKELALPGADKSEGCADWCVQKGEADETGAFQHMLQSKQIKALKARPCDVLLAGRKSRDITDQVRKDAVKKAQEEFNVPSIT